MNLQPTPFGSLQSARPAVAAAAASGEVEGLLLAASARVEAAQTQDGVTVDLLVHLAWHVINIEAWPLCGHQQTALLVAAAQRQMRTLLADTGLAALLIEQGAIEAQLQQGLQRSTADWGLSVDLVVLRQVDIPVGRQIEADVDHLCALRQCRDRRRAAFC